jgi:hypothetical protein
MPNNRPHFRRRYELASFLVSTAIPAALALVGIAHQVQIQVQTQEIENLRAELATIRLNLAVPTNVQPNHGSIDSTNTANTSK